MTAWADLWHEVTTAALLGTERRAVPDPLTGPEAAAAVRAVGDTVADAETHRPVPPRGDSDPARRAVRLLAAGSVAQRAGIRPGAPLDPCRTSDTDSRPTVGPVAVELWRRIASEWPVLDEEFVVRVLESGHRLPPDLVPGMLRRWHGSPLAHARVRAAAGTLADWLIELSPTLATRGRVAADADLTILPAPPVTEALGIAVDALEAADPDPRPLVRAVCNGSFAERIVVANAVRTLSVRSLELLLAALAPRRGEPVTLGLAPAAADLAALRLSLARALPARVAAPPSVSDQEGPSR